MLRLIIVVISLSACSPLKTYNRKVRSLNRYIEHNEKREFKKEQRQLKREFKKQQP